MAWPAHRVAAALVMILGVYLQVAEWIDLHPWNDVRESDGRELLNVALAAATGVLSGALWMSRRWAPLLAVWALSLWAWLQAVTWWAPYLTGVDPDTRQAYGRWFGETVQILPRDATHLPPDANHLTLHALILVALAAAFAAAWRGFSADGVIPPRRP